MKSQDESGANLNQDRVNKNLQRFLQLENLINQRHNLANNQRQLQRQKLLQLQLPSSVLSPSQGSLKAEQSSVPTRRIIRVATLKGNSRTFTCKFQSVTEGKCCSNFCEFFNLQFLTFIDTFLFTLFHRWQRLFPGSGRGTAGS